MRYIFSYYNAKDPTKIDEEDIINYINPHSKDLSKKVAINS